MLKHPEWRQQRRAASEIKRRARKQGKVSHKEVRIAKDSDEPETHASENVTVLPGDNILGNGSAQIPDVGIENRVSYIMPQEEFSFQPDEDFMALFGTHDEQGDYTGYQTWGSI